MPNYDEIEAEIAKLISQDWNVRKETRATIASYGKKALYPLIYAFGKPIPYMEIRLTLRAMPRDDVVRALVQVLRNRSDASQQVLQHAEKMLSILGENIEDYRTACKEVDLIIDDSWIRCSFELEHTFATNPDCYWLSAIITVTANDKPEIHYFNPASKETIDNFIGRLVNAGFKRTKSSTMREWVSWTYSKGDS